jgi:hypothetical protein
MTQELAYRLSMDEVRTVLKKQFESALDLTLTTASFSDLQHRLKNPS